MLLIFLFTDYGLLNFLAKGGILQCTLHVKDNMKKNTYSRNLLCCHRLLHRRDVKTLEWGFQHVLNVYIL